MTRRAALDAALELPPKERFQLVQEIWESFSDSDEIKLTAEQEQLLDRRLEEYERDRSATIPWEQARKQLRQGK